MLEPAPVAAVQDFANEIHRLSADTGRLDLGERLQVEAQRYHQPETTAVLVGNASQGKSSLVNALLGRSGFLPVGSDLTTSSHIAVRYGSTLGAEICPGEGDEALAVPLDELASWVTVDGNPDNERNVRAAVITCPHPLLSSGLVLLDTPGVGGLDGGHAELTMAALPNADVVVFVGDASAPLSQPELAFLERCTERVASVIFAVTKTDAFRGWRTIVAENRTLLDRYAPQLADVPILGVSSRLALAAARSNDPAMAERARGESGIDELGEHLRNLTRRGAAVKLVNLVRVGEAVLDELERVETTRIQSTLQDPKWVDSLEEERTRLDDLLVLWNRWRADLATHFDRLALDVDTHGELALTRLEQRLQTTIDQRPKEILDKLTPELDASLGAVWGEVEGLVIDRVSMMVTEFAEQLAIAPVDADVETLPMPDYLGDTADLRRERATTKDRRGWEETFVQSYPVLISAGVPLTVGSMLGQMGVAGAAVLAGPVGVVIGAGFAGVMMTARRRQTKRARNKQAAAEFLRLTMSDARRALAKESRQLLAESRRGLEEEIGRALAQRRRELEARFQELQNLTSEDARVREGVQAAAEQRQRSFAELRVRARSLRADLATTSTP